MRVLTFLLLLVPFQSASASALAQPPSDLLEWEVTTGAVAATVFFRDPGTSQPFTSASVIVVHDTASGSDIYVRLSGTATTPGTTTPSRTFRIKAGESFNFDGRWTAVSYISSDGTTPALRIIATW